MATPDDLTEFNESQVAQMVADTEEKGAEMQLAIEHEPWGSGFASTQTPEFLALNPNASLGPHLIVGPLYHTGPLSVSRSMSSSSNSPVPVPNGYR